MRRILGGFALVLALMGTASAERLPIKTYTTADGLTHLEFADFSDAAWSNLRITAIKLDSFQNGPLLQ